VIGTTGQGGSTGQDGNNLQDAKQAPWGPRTWQKRRAQGREGRKTRARTTSIRLLASSSPDSRRGSGAVRGAWARLLSPLSPRDAKRPISETTTAGDGADGNEAEGRDKRFEA